MIPLSFLGPLLVWYAKGSTSDFVAYHAVQAFWWSVITLVFTVVVGILTCGAGSLGLFFFWVLALYVGLRAKEGEWFGYWFIGQFGLEGTFF